ncbi:hypothetical protein [Mycobacterium phage WXIN]|nr:hypothetical protein [Mycobacterium phage WXIN]
MSLSKPRENVSPVKRYFRIKGKDGGGLTYWDKSAEEEKTVGLPFAFVVLDTLTCVSGFHQASKSSIWSNEIRDTRSESLTVRSKDGILAEGLWNDIKDSRAMKGAKFANSVYVAFKDGDELVIGNILLSGAAVSEWFDFKKGKSLDSAPGVSITGFDGPRLSGTNEYFVPVFGTWTPNDLNAATALDETLQDYLSGALSRKAEEPEDSQPQYTPPPAQAPLMEEPPF